MKLLTILFLSLSLFAAKKPLIKLVAEIDSKIVTSRDVEAFHIVSTGEKLSDGDFNTAADRYIVESMIFGEAQSFGIAKVTEEEIESAFKHARAKIFDNPTLKSRWLFLDFNDAKLKELVTLHLRAEKLIRYRSESSVSQVSDEEAKDYFEKNKFKFGSNDFEAFKANIKKFIARKNADARLKEWIDILKKKHRFKKLSESA